MSGTLELAIDGDPAAYIALLDNLDEPVADQLLGEREVELRQRAREISARELVPRAAEADRTHTFVDESYLALARAGLVGLPFPKRLGGAGENYLGYVLAVEEITAACAATSLVYMTQSNAANPIAFAGGLMADRYIPDLLSGRSYGALGITEPEAGSDVASIRTTLRASGDGYVLRGGKTLITNAGPAEVIVCFATVDRSRGRSGITAVVVEGSWPGVSHGEPLEKVGMHGSITAELFFDDVDVPHDHVLGTVGGGWDILRASLSKARLSAAAQGIGLARAAYSRALAAMMMLHDTRLPERTVQSFARIRGEILQAQLLLSATARVLDATGELESSRAAVTKQACTDLGWSVAARVVWLLGPYGDVVELGIERCLRDAKITQIYDGTNQIQRIIITRDIVDALERAWPQ